jgi:hypothetical protein
MPHTFWDTGHHARIVGQDCILRAGLQPALVRLFTSDSGGLPTRPTVLAGFQVLGKVCGIGQECLRHMARAVNVKLFLRGP